MVDPGAHETGVGVLWCANDRFAAHIERSVDQDGTTREVIEGLNQIVVYRVVLAPNGLSMPNDFSCSLVIGMRKERCTGATSSM